MFLISKDFLEGGDFYFFLERAESNKIKKGDKKMKKICLLFLFLSLVSFSFAQTIVDNFHGYSSNGELQAVWVQTGGWTDATLQTTGGADGTTGSMKLQDSGWSNGVLATGIATPPGAGGYKLTFKYMNGQSDTAWSNLTVSVVQNDSIKAVKSLGGSVVASWTAAETAPMSLTGDPINILIDNSGNLPGATNVCAIDEIKLESAVVPLTVVLKPTDAWYIGGTTTITAEPDGGSYNYSKVDFDVNADSSIEYTDNTEPFEFVWDTTADMVTSGPIDLKATLTDSLSATDDITGTYIIDNRLSGRQSLILNGDFSAWTSGDPDNWTPYQTDVAFASHGQGNSYAAGAFPSLTINCTATVTNRYFFLSSSWGGYFTDIQTKLWGRHAYCRMYYFTSDDGGSSWVNTMIDVTVGNPYWLYVESAVEPEVGEIGQQVAICTHCYGAGDYYWDDVVVNGIDLVESAVNDWNLY